MEERLSKNESHLSSPEEKEEDELYLRGRYTSRSLWKIGFWKLQAGRTDYRKSITVRSRIRRGK
jgi:hypothetical protein